MADHRLSGTLTVNGSPAARTVYAYRRDTGAYLGSTTSDAGTGAWEITGMDDVGSESVFILAIDTVVSGNNAAIRDFLTSYSTTTTTTTTTTTSTTTA